MNILDIIFIIPLLWLMYRGFRKGLIIELATLAALILGIYLSIRFSGVVAGFLIGKFGMNTSYVSIIAFIITFVGVVIIVNLIGRILEKFIDLIALGFINKFLGAVFGLAKAVILLSVIIFIINMFDKNQKIFSEERREGSFLYKPIALVVPAILPMIDLEQLDKYKERLQGDDEKVFTLDL